MISPLRKLNKTLYLRANKRFASSSSLLEVNGNEGNSGVIRSVLIDNKLRDRLRNVFSQNVSHYTMREKHLSFSYKNLVSELPSELSAMIKRFKTCPEESSVFLIRNLPIDDNLPNTPADGNHTFDKTSFISESCLTGFSQILGDVYGYSHKKNGDLVNNICPISSRERSQSNEGSDTLLKFHTEEAFFRFRPDYLAIYCLRADHERRAETTFVDVRDVIKGLSAEEIKILRQPLFSFPAPELFEKKYGKAAWSKQQPILSGSFLSPEIVYFSKMKSSSHDAIHAFSKVTESILRSRSFSVKLEPGDLMIINNLKVTHGRSRFLPRYDGKDRWLQRVYVTNNLQNGHVKDQTDHLLVLSDKISQSEMDLV